MTPTVNTSPPTRPLVWMALPQPAPLEHPLSQAEPEEGWTSFSREPGGLRLLSSLPDAHCLSNMLLRAALQLLPRKIHCSAAPRVLSTSVLGSSLLMELHTLELLNQSISRPTCRGPPLIRRCLAEANSSAPLCPVYTSPLTKVRRHRLSHRYFGRSVCFPSPL
jgi:hypothetical protein